MSFEGKVLLGRRDFSKGGGLLQVIKGEYEVEFLIRVWRIGLGKCDDAVLWMRVRWNFWGVLYFTEGVSGLSAISNFHRVR